jgi:hypothetical protein
MSMASIFGVLSASQFPERLKDGAGEFFKPGAW